MSVKHTLTVTFEPNEPCTVFVLEIGGFLPLCFTSAEIILVDRNILSNASNILNGGGHKDNKANVWWLRFLDSPTFLLNPVLCALEGSSQKVPIYGEFCSEFERGKAILGKMFPKARVIEYSDIHYKYAYDLVKFVMVSYEHDIRFLLEAVPLIVERKPTEKLQGIESTLFDLAKSCGLKRLTFSFIACLSCLYESRNGTPPSIGRQILKPKNRYTTSMAHNALMDLYALNLLVQANAKLDARIGLCTADKGLLGFWCALRVPFGGSSTPTGFTFTFEFTPQMFQALNKQEIIALKHRVEAKNFQTLA